MLTKIGNDWVDVAEIAAARYFPENSDGDGPEHYAVTLRCGGCIWLYDCSPAELEAALVRAGAAALWDEISSSPADIQTLIKLSANGFLYLVRDTDGMVYAYKYKPLRVSDNGWVGAGPGMLRFDAESFPFVSESAQEPFDIGSFLLRLRGGEHAEV